MKEKLYEWLKQGEERGASDLHLSVGLTPTLRINGELTELNDIRLKPSDTEILVKEILTEDQQFRLNKQGELDFSYSIPNLSRFRVNAYRQRSCYSLAFRMIPRSVPTLESLYLPDILKQLCRRPHGLIIVTGPTGSGKSTTLAAMINYMNQTFRKHIITLEDPIEYLHNHQHCIIQQREVGFDTQSFPLGLRAALRQDPDIILIGEIRDLETIQTALTAAETGHLVLGTLHTNDAATTIDRIIDVFPSDQQTQIRIQLASELVGVISQRLFPTADYQHRRAAVEILLNTSAVSHLIRQQKVYQLPSVIQMNQSAGMQTMETAIHHLLRSGAIAAEAAEPYLVKE